MSGFHPLRTLGARADERLHVIARNGEMGIASVRLDINARQIEPVSSLDDILAFDHPLLKDEAIVVRPAYEAGAVWGGKVSAEQDPGFATEQGFRRFMPMLHVICSRPELGELEDRLPMSAEIDCSCRIALRRLPWAICLQREAKPFHVHQ